MKEERKLTSGVYYLKQAFPASNWSAPFISQALQEALPGPDAEARGRPVSAGWNAAGFLGALSHGSGTAALRQWLPVAWR